MDHLAVWTIHDPPFGKAECLLIKGGCRFHVGHRQHCRYRTVELFIERIDFSGHNTPFVRRVFELNFSRRCSSCTARRNFLAAEIENTLRETSGQRARRLYSYSSPSSPRARGMLPNTSHYRGSVRVAGKPELIRLPLNLRW